MGQKNSRLSDDEDVMSGEEENEENGGEEEEEEEELTKEETANLVTEMLEREAKKLEAEAQTDEVPTPSLGQDSIADNEETKRLLAEAEAAKEKALKEKEKRKALQAEAERAAAEAEEIKKKAAKEEEARVKAETAAKKSAAEAEEVKKKVAEEEAARAKAEASARELQEHNEKLQAELKSAKKSVVNVEKKLVEAEGSLKAEQMERASLLARVNSGRGVKKSNSSLASAIIQWDKDGGVPLPDDAPGSPGPAQQKVTKKNSRNGPPPMMGGKGRGGELWRGVSQSSSQITRKKPMKDPEDFIEKLQQECSLTYLKSLEKKLATEQDSWLVKFVQKDGLDAIIDANYVMDKKTNKKLSDVVVQIQLVMCIRALLNNNSTLDIIINDQEIMQKLVDLTVRTQNVMMKVKFFELFAALVLYSPVGWKGITEAFKVGGSSFHNSRFSYICEIMQKENDTQFRRASVSLVNAIIQAKEDYVERVAVRQDFIREGLLTALNLIESENFVDVDEPLSKQLEFFQESWAQDHKEKV